VWTLMFCLASERPAIFEMSASSVVKTLTGGVSGLFKKNQIDFIEGVGALAGDGRVKVGEVMTHDPVTCTPDCDVEQVMGMMSERRIAKVPVIEDGRLTGIISVGDVIKVMYDRVHSENQHLLGYIHGTTY